MPLVPAGVAYRGCLNMGRALLKVDQIRALERAAVDRLPPGTLMQRAGHAAATWIAQQAALTPEPLLILCGPGNNGGDGLACAMALRASGQPTICWMPIAPRAADGAAALAAYRAAGGVTFAEWPPPEPFAAVIDALFGIGLARPLADPYLGALRWLGDRGCPVYALDLPSGLDADTGSWVGGCRGLAAHATITFLADKPGLHTLDGVDAAGQVTVDTLAIHGVVQEGHASRIRLVDPGDFATLLQPRLANSHKGMYGDVLVAGGGTGMVGAALLAARGALRLGAGRVFVEIAESDLRRLDPCQPELMFRSRGGTGPVDAIAVGCGLGVGAVSLAALEATLDCEAAVLVADADALNLMAQHDALRARFIKRTATRVVTPHPLEAARLLGRDSSQVQADRVGAALALADALQAIAVLKGAGSVVATPDGRAWINPTGGPALATAGAGDVLSGMIAALCAQGYDALQGVLAAVWLHGAAAAEHGADVGLVAGEIAPLAVRAWMRLRARKP